MTGGTRHRPCCWICRTYERVHVISPPGSRHEYEECESCTRDLARPAPKAPKVPKRKKGRRGRHV